MWECSQGPAAPLLYTASCALDPNLGAWMSHPLAGAWQARLPVKAWLLLFSLGQVTCGAIDHSPRGKAAVWFHFCLPSKNTVH